MHFLSKSKFVKIIFTLLCVVLGVILPEHFLVPIAILNVLTIGVIHGSNDLFILSKTLTTSKNTPFAFLFFSYTLFVLIMVLALNRVPQWALLLFVSASAFHFGEQQWHNSSYVNTAKLNMFYGAYGTFLFSLLFYTHANQTTEIIYDIANLLITEDFLWSLLILSGILLLIASLVNFNQIKEQLFFQLVILLVLILLFSQTSLVWSFSVYFVLWHSIPSLREQANVLFPYSKTPILAYMRHALLYWIMAMVGFGFISFFCTDNTTSLLALFFSFLAAITIPHVVVIFWMHKKK